MEYYIITDISENYNYVNDLACSCKMEIIDYNGNKAKIDAIVINPSRESFVV